MIDTRALDEAVRLFPAMLAGCRLAGLGRGYACLLIRSCEHAIRREYHRIIADRRA